MLLQMYHGHFIHEESKAQEGELEEEEGEGEGIQALLLFIHFPNTC